MCGVSSVAGHLFTLFMGQIDDDGHVFGIAGRFLLGDGPQMTWTAHV